MSLVLWSVLSCVIFFSDALNYSNRWTVQIDGDNEEANRLARKHGFVNQGKIIDNYYSFEHQMVERISSVRTTHLHKGLISEPNVKMVEQQELKHYDLQSSNSFVEFNANDPRLEEMWYIKRNDGQPTYNVIDVWERNITGAGVVIAVVDEGLDPEHPELKANYDATASFDVVDNDTYPLPSDPSTLSGHGDKCAGIIAAVLNNSNCGVGLAYKARVGGIRLINQTLASDADEARAFSHATDHIDIYSNSWGPLGWGNVVQGPGHLSQLALRRGTEKGRRGKGSIYVFSSGNGGGFYDDSCAFDGYVNSIYTIAITGLRSDGSLPTFSEPCSGLMAVAYSRDSLGDLSKVITADANKGCADDFGASSASAAMASGLIALMLSARPSLSWRDVQHIIVRTARPGPVKSTIWTTNNAGLKVNDRVGFGLMDAKKMVDLAVNWTTVPPKVNCTVPLYGVNSEIPSNGVLEEVIDLTMWNDFCGSRINFLEHVEVAVNLKYTRRGDLLIKLVSPQGTLSNLTHYRMMDSATGATDLNWVLMSLHYWGESAIGSWRLTLQNSQLHNRNTGTLFNWTLILHGTEESPLDYNPHISTTVSPQTTESSTFSAVFTNLNASGRNGPTALGSHYTGQDHDGQVTLSSGIQLWTVPYAGDYRIEAVGAAGGYDTHPNSTQHRGRGARMIGTFTFSKDEIIQILVGQEGGTNNYNDGSGGGGGTFVVRESNTSLIIAGGGGGVDTVLSRHAGCDANTSTTGNPGYRSWSGGSNGHGAQTADGGTSGGGGGGFYSSGRSGKNFNGTIGNGGEGGKGFLQGGEGGRARKNNVDGGFGGGGGGEGTLAGGGGGGYSGGSSGSDFFNSCGGGGGSYNTGTNQQNDCCFNTAGHGQVTITLL